MVRGLFTAGQLLEAGVEFAERVQAVGIDGVGDKIAEIRYVGSTFRQYGQFVGELHHILLGNADGLHVFAVVGAQDSSAMLKQALM